MLVSWRWHAPAVLEERSLTDGTTAPLALTESEARLRLVLDATGTGTFVWYAGQDRSEADRRMLELFGLARTVN